MKINQLLIESEQLGEADTLGVGRGTGGFLGKAANAAGGAIGGLAGAASAFKQGYQSGKGFVSGQKVGRTQPQADPAPVARTVSGTNLDAMADKDLEAMKKQIDATLAARQQQAAAPAQPAAGATAQPASGATPQQAGQAASKPKTGDKVTVSGKEYQWLGAQWAEVNPATGRAGKIAPASLRAQLDAAPRTPGVTVQTGGRSSPAPRRGSATPAAGSASPRRGSTAPASGSAAPQTATAESFHSKFLGIDL